MSELTERNYFRQAPDIVNGTYSLSKSESDLVFALLTTIDKDDEDFKDYTFTKAELEAKIGVQIHSQQLQDTAEKLMSRVIKIKMNTTRWSINNWFSYFEYNDGLITCRFDKSMKSHYLQLKQFVLADVRQLMQMKSEYSKRIYLMLKERAKFGTRTFTIQELQDKLLVPESYKIYNRFKDKVLNQAVKDINKFTDLEIKNVGTNKKPMYFEEEKHIRKVVSVTFHFKKNVNDLIAFIELIREQYTNEALYHNKEGKIIKCSENGLLYYADDERININKDDALKIWEWLHENRAKLYIFQASLISEDVFV